MRDSADTLTFLQSDHLGGTAATTSGDVAGGSQTSKQKYYAYGTIRTTVGTVPTPYEFTGQRLDASTSLYYYGARYYDTAIGVFIQADTIVPNPGNPQSLNRYSYTCNNSLR
jgi:RHS repeat-associated protein